MYMMTQKRKAKTTAAIVSENMITLLHCVSIKKLCHYTFVHNFGKCRPIFKFFFTIVFSMKFKTISMSYVSPHYKGVTPLPCKTQKTETGKILLHVTQ